MSTPSPSAIKLSPRETETAIAVLQNLRGGEIKIDYVGMAETLGLKSDRVAAAAWSALRKKLLADGKHPPPKVSAAKTAKPTKTLPKGATNKGTGSHEKGASDVTDSPSSAPVS